MQKPILDKEAMIKWLGEVIDAELEKSDDEIDMALVMECDAYLAELMSDVVISEEQIKENIASIMKKHSNDKITSTVSRRTPRRRRLIAIACAAAIFAGGTVSAYAFVPAFLDMVRDVLNLGQGSQIDGEGITFTYVGRTTIYKSMDELVQGERLNIMYSHEVPDCPKIKYVTCSGEGETFMCTITFADGMGAINIEAGEIDVSRIENSVTILEGPNNVEYYIIDAETMYTAIAVHNGWTYNVATNSMETIAKIIESIY